MEHRQYALNAVAADLVVGSCMCGEVIKSSDWGVVSRELRAHLDANGNRESLFVGVWKPR